MKEVKRKVSWDVHIQVAKHSPHTHPAWKTYNAYLEQARQLIAPTCQQLEEDAT